ncbi:MAG: hypothetical protein QNJ72_44145 [Pleurocapsa sp. MO_226.B13]|nr:hypothetical protein [Pleurocapsa sp. MO_226.B13]
MKNWERIALIFTQYLIIVVLPLGITITFFLVFNQNIAEYNNAPLGIKLAGPIAAYVALLIIFDIVIQRAFSTWRRALLDWQEQEKQQKYLSYIDLDIDKAMQLSGKLSELISRYIIVEILLIRREYEDPHQGLWTAVSITRKKIYGFQNLVGEVTIYEGKYKLREVLGAAINNSKFIDDLKKEAATILEIKYSDLTPPKVEKLEINDISSLDEAWQSFEKETKFFRSTGLHKFHNNITNIVWRQCEKALHDPASALEKQNLLPP